MFISPLLSLLAPHECLGCGAEGALACVDCRRQLRPAISRCYRCQSPNETVLTCTSCSDVSPLHAVHAAVRYEALAKDLVWKLKFGRARSAAGEIGRMLAFNFGRSCRPLGNVVVTHVPTATTRVRQRGYDQAALIARSFARTSGADYIPLLARQTKNKQVGASQEVRASQQRDAFRPIHTRRIKGATVLLIDDVITTGATLEAAATTLKAAGATRVDAAVFAQA